MSQTEADRGGNNYSDVFLQQFTNQSQLHDLVNIALWVVCLSEWK